jgi:hypothetical protein
MHRAIVPSGSGRSVNWECAGGRSFTTNNSMRCGLRQEVRRELLAEAKKHQVWKRLCQIPSIGPIRAAVLLGILQTPHRFRTNRQLWSYSGFGIETHSSADHRSVDGQLQRAKKQSSIRGLNRNCNHDLKNLFKGALIMASSVLPGGRRCEFFDTHSGRCETFCRILPKHIPNQIDFENIERRTTWLLAS